MGVGRPGGKLGGKAGGRMGERAWARARDKARARARARVRGRARGRARGRSRLVSVRFIFVSGSFRVRFGLMSEDISFGSDEFSDPPIGLGSEWLRVAGRC